MMPVLRRGALPSHGAKRPGRSRGKDHGLPGWRQRMVSSAGFTLVEVVVSSSILAFALAGSFRGWSQGQALVQQATQRQVLLDAIAQDLERQQGLVIQTLKTTLPWACDTTLSALQQRLQTSSPGLPDAVERQWLIQGEPPVLAVRYTAPNLQAPRERLLALSGGSACE